MSDDFQKIVDSIPDTIYLTTDDGEPLDEGDNAVNLSPVEKIAIAHHMQEWGTDLEQTINRIIENAVEKINDEDEDVPS